MRFISGPRQVGKSTLAKNFLQEVNCNNFYYNWDLRSIKNRFLEDNYFYHSDVMKEKTDNKKWICFDEIHKYVKWKDILKDAFDSFEDKYSFIVTGSARRFHHAKYIGRIDATGSRDNEPNATDASSEDPTFNFTSDCSAISSIKSIQMTADFDEGKTCGKYGWGSEITNYGVVKGHVYKCDTVVAYYITQLY